VDRGERYRAGCKGKKALSEEVARNRATRMNLMPYLCEFCFHWHVGHSGEQDGGVFPTHRRKSGKPKRRRAGKGPRWRRWRVERGHRKRPPPTETD